MNEVGSVTTPTEEILAANREKRLANLDAHRRKARELTRKNGSARRAAQRRRLLVQVAWIEDVDPMVVFDRDGWVCQHCGITCRKIQSGLRWTQPRLIT